jgi:FkbM family methyltransferase
MIKNKMVAVIEHFPAFAAFLRNLKEIISLNDAALPTPWGFTLAGHKEMASGTFEPDETSVVRELLAEVDVFVNVGANIGYYCCHALSLRKAVIAVEPNARNLHYLLCNIRNNGWSKLAQVYPLALGSSTDILEMWGSGTGASLIKGWASNPESLVKLVPITTLDRVIGNELKSKKSLILVDIEGAENMMLQGAPQVMANDIRPIWLVEIATTEHQPTGTKFNPNFKNTFEMFFKLGYKAYAVNNISQEIGIHEIQCTVEKGFKFKTNNFIFK